MANPQATRSFLSQALVVLASLVCGTGVWLVVQFTERNERTLELQIAPSPTMDTRVEFVLKRERTAVSFSFPAAEAGKMTADNFVILIDIPEIATYLGDDLATPGTLQITNDMVTARDPESLDMQGLNITVGQVLSPQVTWEARYRHIEAVIKPTIVGAPPEGYEIAPERALVEGGDSLVAILTEKKDTELRQQGVTQLEIPTRPIDVGGKTGIVREQVELDLPQGVSLLPRESKDRTIVLDITERTVERRLRNIPIQYQFVSAGDGLQAVIVPDKVDVVIEGRQSAVNSITADMLTFGLFDVVERPGETREVAIDARFKDPAVRREIVRVATQPPTVTVTILGAATPTPTASSPTATPALPSPSPTARQEPTPSPTPATPTPSPALTPSPTAPVTPNADDRPTT